MTISFQAPLRLSIAGGGTDLPEYYSRRPTTVLSLAVNLFIRVEVGQDVEHDTSPLTDLFRWRNQGMKVRVRADCSPGAGLGGSGALTVCLVAAERQLKGQCPDRAAIALEAYRWERELLGEPVGFQDQFAAAGGGATLMSAAPGTGPRAQVDPELTDDLCWLLDHCIVIAETPIRRTARTLLTDLSKSPAVAHGDSSKGPVAVSEFTGPIRCRDGHAFGELLQRHWEAKKANLPTTSNAYLDNCVGAALDMGATGAKVMGAGGGGFLMAAGPPSTRAGVEEGLRAVGCVIHRLQVDRTGVCRTNVTTRATTEGGNQ